MRTLAEYGQCQTLFSLAPGTEATWAFEWEIGAGQFYDIDAEPVMSFSPFVPPPAVQSIEVIRQWTELVQNRTYRRFAVFRNAGAETAYFVVNLIRVPNLH